MSASSTWKLGEFQDVPDEVTTAQGQIKVEQKMVTIQNGKDSVNVFYQEVTPEASVSRQPPLLLLHGMKFTSQTWNDLGTLTFLGALGHRTVAVDVPGYGKTPALKSGSGTPEERVEFLENFLSSVGLLRPVIVSPSMAGMYAVPFLLREPATAGLVSSGWIPVAPAATETFPAEAYKDCRIPVAVVYGSEDNLPHAPVSLKNLQNLARKEVLCYQGAGHPCYLDKLKEWHKTLYNFLRMNLIQQKTVTIKNVKDNVRVFYQETLPVDSAPKHPPVLLLHGMSFSSQSWNDLGTLTFISWLGHRAVALDLPGYGNTPDIASAKGSPEENIEFLENFTSAVGLEKPIIISPSMSGSFALPYLLKEPSEADKICSGYIPIAPVNTQNFSAETYRQCKIPVVVVYGSRDTRLGGVSLRNLQNFSRREICCFEGAGHACYLNKPEEWHETLRDFIKLLSEHA